MTYQVIARKWRPQTFEEVTGQEAITRTLRNGIEHERLHHAYLFSGARGVGKTTTARLLAKAVNCHRFDQPTATPCAFTDPEACPSCREIAEGRSIDVLEIDAASNTSVDNVRESILNTVGTRPARDRYKVFIIDEVHMLSGSAFNALLKTLEEPPPRVLFIMATTEQHKVPDTILSRCQLFEFRTIAAAKIAERLRLIADAEGVKISEDAVREIARAGEGSMRDAQSAFDQVISFSEGDIGTADVETALGLAGTEMLARVMRSIAVQTPADTLAVVDDLVMRGHDLRNFCRDLLAHLRDLLVVKVTGERGTMADASESERRELAEVASNFSESDLVRFFHSLTETERHLRESAHPRYQLEIGLVKLIEMRRLAPLGQIIERLGALEQALRTGTAPAGGPSASSPPGASFPGGSGTAHDSSGSAGGRHSASGIPSLSSGPVTPNATGTAVPAKSVVEAPARPSEANRRPRPFDPATAPVREESAVPATKRPTLPPSPASSGLKLVTPAPPGAGVNAPFQTTGQNATPPDLFAGHEPPPPPSPFNDEDFVPGEDWAGRRLPTAAATAPFDTTGAAYAAGGVGAAPATQTSHAPVEPSHAPVEPPAAIRAVPPTRDFADVPADASDAPTVQPGDSIGLIKKALDNRRKPFLAIALEEARRVAIEGDELIVEFGPEGKHLCDLLSKSDGQRIVGEACREVLGRELSVCASVRTPGESPDMPLTKQDEERLDQQRLREFAENHPFVQEVLKTFRAEIIEVRRVDKETP